MKNIIKILILGAAVFSLTNCSKDKNKGNSIANNNSYYFSNGYCIRRSDNQMVDPSFCNYNNGTGGNGGSVSQYFRWQNNTCYLIENNQQVDQAYCTSNPFVYSNNECIDTLQNEVVDNKYCQGNTNPNDPWGGGGYPQPTGQCYGTFYYGQYPYFQYVQCYGYNCSGYTLNNFQTGMPQYCQ